MVYNVKAFEEGQLSFMASFKKFREALEAAVNAAPKSLAEEVISVCMSLEEEDNGDVNCKFEEGGFTLEVTTE